MTQQEQIEVIRQTCINANPQIKKEQEDWQIFIANLDSLPTDIEDAFGAEPLLGRPIRLADVLLAIKAVPYQKWPGGWAAIPDEELRDLVLNHWNLPADDLIQQSDGTIEFIYQLLK
jgi:hypothetical protein